MKIAIDNRPLRGGHKVRGIGVYTRELIRALKKAGGMDVATLDVSKANLSKYDIVHSQEFHPYFPTLPRQKLGKRMVVTIHDAIPLVYPEKYPPGLSGKLNFFKQRQRLKNVDAIITVSETSKKDICRLLGVSPSKVYVIHNAPRGVFKNSKTKKAKSVRKRYKLPKTFVLYVGDVNYNKNLPTLIKACKKAGKTLVICGKQAAEIESLGTGLDVLAGPQDWLRFLFNKPHPETAHHGKLLGLVKANKVIRTGFVPDEDLVEIYKLATVYVQPSFYEGFGMPILEAASCGVPVIAAKNNAHVEVAGSAVAYFEPKSSEDLAKKIERIFENRDLREKLIKKGMEIAKNYSWEKSARETAKVYKTLMEKG